MFRILVVLLCLLHILLLPLILLSQVYILEDFLDQLDLDLCEISDGSIIIPHNEKCKIIKKLSKNRTVLSEVGSKDSGIIVSPFKWVSWMKAELDAGSWKVIAEGREAGNSDGVAALRRIQSLREVDEERHDADRVHDRQQGDERLEQVHAGDSRGHGRREMRHSCASRWPAHNTC